MTRAVRLLFIIPLLLCAFSVSAEGAGVPFIHKFEIWGDQKTKTEKLAMLLGFTNGTFFGGSDRSVQLVTCMSANMSYEQAIAMVDKYYKDHPEEWSKPAGMEMYIALTIATGPCPYHDGN